MIFFNFFFIFFIVIFGFSIDINVLMSLRLSMNMNFLLSYDWLNDIKTTLIISLLQFFLNQISRFMFYYLEMRIGIIICNISFC